VFKEWVVNRFIPALRAQFPESFLAANHKKGRRFHVVSDNAKYRCGSTICLDQGKQRFNPQIMSKVDLVNAMSSAGCNALAVPFLDNLVTVKMTKEEGAKKGSSSHPNVPAIKAAASKWLLANKPQVLENDFEAALREASNGWIRVIWNGPECPDFNAVEMAWSQVRACGTQRRIFSGHPSAHTRQRSQRLLCCFCTLLASYPTLNHPSGPIHSFSSCQTKGYAAAKYFNGRTVEQLAADIHDGMYTDKKAKPGVFNITGGYFVLHPDEDGNDHCPAAQKLVGHCYHGDQKSIQSWIKDDKVLGGIFPDVEAPQDLLKLAVAANSRNVLHRRARDYLISYEGENESELGGSGSDSSNDSSGSESSEG
jgi:hypothetical protein